MFNLFKKQKEVVMNPAPVAVATASIEELIHKDAYSAQELLLSEANKILSEPSSYNEEKYQRLLQLSKLGFSNAEEVKLFNEEKNKREAQEKIRTKISYYSQTYPLHKFINEAAVKTICNKYGLLLAFASDYIAEIPVKNQKEIVGFKVARKDIREPYEVYRGSMFMPYYSHFDSICRLTMSEEECNAYDNERVQASHLLIIAPVHKLDMRGRVKNGHILQIKDPIVLQPVEEGYLIVSSWGLEASDELVMNPKHN